MNLRLAPTFAAAALFGCVDAPTDSSDALQVDQIERHATGTPYYVGGQLGRVDMAVTAASAATALAPALPMIKAELGVPAANLEPTRVERDAIGWTHVRMAQTKNGLPVVGGEAIVHLDPGNTIRSVDSGLVDRDLPAVPAIDGDFAARTALAATTGGVSTGDSALVYLVSNRDNQLYLTWRVSVAGGANGLPVDDEVFVDALSGRVVDVHPQIFTLKNRTITNGGGGAFPVNGAPTIGTEAAAPTDPVALAAYNNTGLTYDCYKTLYNRDSYDNAGAGLTSQVHVVFQTGNGGTSPNNAVWSAQVRMMAYGDGDGQQMKQLAYSFDVTSHELTHAVTSSTANLVYQNESGALNESMSDIMGAVCQAWRDKAVTADTWLVGEEIWTPNTPGDALRYMASPTMDNQSPDNYAERYTGTQDNGGVHLNSGISNLQFYLLSVGGKHPRAKTTVTVPGIGIEKAGAIMQRALTTKWTTNTNFVAARTGAEAAAQELYPGTCAKTAVSLAWSAVGVGAAPAPDTVPPSVAITSPSNGSRVDAGFAIEVNTTDDQCINKVELRVDGTLVQTVTQAPYRFQTDANLSAGSHTIEVTSFDAFSSNKTTAMVTVGNNGGGGSGGGGGDGNDGSDITGGCNTSGSGAGLLLGLGLLGLMFRRRR